MEERTSGDMDGELQNAVNWTYVDDRWEAQLGFAYLIVVVKYGRYAPVVELNDTLFTEYGFDLCIWARWRAEEIARTGGRGGVFP